MTRTEELEFQNCQIGNFAMRLTLEIKQQIVEQRDAHQGEGASARLAAEAKARYERALALELETYELDERYASEPTGKLDKATYPDDAIEALNYLWSGAMGPWYPKGG